MNDKEFFSKVLGIEKPWYLSSVDLEPEQNRIVFHIACERSSKKHCPECGRQCPGYDSQERQLRHLDTLQYQTYLRIKVPRVKCPEHGVRQIRVPWNDGDSRYTRDFEIQVIDWAREASVSAVHRRLRLSYTAVANIIKRAVKRGLARRGLMQLERISVDETSYKKGKLYITVVTDQDSGAVLYAAPDRGASSLAGFYAQLSPEQISRIISVAMDMWDPFIKATREALEQAEEKICFDKFHVAKMLTEGVNTVRAREHCELLQQGCDDLKNTKYLWLRNGKTMSQSVKAVFEQLCQSALQTARAWSLKEAAMSLWHYVRRGWARKFWEQWIAWASNSDLPPFPKIAKTIQRYLWGIINAVVLKETTARSESINGRIQMVKRRSRGFRNIDNYINAIYFHLGKLDLYP